MATRKEFIAEAFAHLRKADPVMAELIDARPDYDPDAWLKDLPKLNLFACLVFQVIGQQLSMKATRKILERLTDRFAGKMPSPEQLSELDQADLREIGMSWRKAGTVLDLAARFASGELSEKQLRRLPDDEVVKQLTEVPGIGTWTVHGALLIALKRPDVVPIDDLMLRNAVKRRYGLDHRPRSGEVGEIAEPWHPYGSLAVNLLFASAESDSP